MTMTAGGMTARFDAEPGTVEFYVWQLIHAAEAMRGHWAESDEGRRGDIWRDLHTAADIATAALEEGPEAAAGVAEAERRLGTAGRPTAGPELASQFPMCEVRVECDRCPPGHPAIAYPTLFVGSGRHATGTHPHDATLVYLADGVERHRLDVAGGTRWIANANDGGQIQIISP